MARWVSCSNHSRLLSVFVWLLTWHDIIPGLAEVTTNRSIISTAAWLLKWGDTILLINLDLAVNKTVFHQHYRTKFECTVWTLPCNEGGIALAFDSSTLLNERCLQVSDDEWFRRKYTQRYHTRCSLYPEQSYTTLYHNRCYTTLYHTQRFLPIYHTVNYAQTTGFRRKRNHPLCMSDHTIQFLWKHDIPVPHNEWKTTYLTYSTARGWLHLVYHTAHFTGSAREWFGHHTCRPLSRARNRVNVCIDVSRNLLCTKTTQSTFLLWVSASDQRESKLKAADTADVHMSVGFSR